MTDFWQRLKQRKLVQWAVAYIAAAFALLQGIDIVAQQFGWAEGLQRGITLAMVLGFFVTLLLAWYHGDRGEQKVSGTELLLLALLLSIGGGLLWHFAGIGAENAPTGTADLATSPMQQVTEVPDKSVAVLPFANDSGDKGEQYFSDGLSEGLITALSQFGGLKVISQSSSFQFRGSSDSVADIARKLGVAHLLQGGVRRLGDQVRIRAELVKATDGSTVWSQHYDRPYTDLFKLQDDITASVAAALKTKLLASADGQRQSARPPSGNLDAYNAYLKGNAQANTEAGTRRAIDLFQQARKLDPDYAAAYAQEAGAWGFLSAVFVGGNEGQQAYVRANQAVDTALRIDPELAQAHYALAFLRLNAEFDWNGALREARRLAELAPNSLSTFSMMHQTLSAVGQADAGAVMARQAIALNPLSAGSYESLALNLWAIGQGDQADAALKKAIELGPGNSRLHANLALVRAQRGDASGALAAAKGEPPGFWHAFAMAIALQLGDDRAAADAALDHLIDQYSESGAYQIAEVHALRKDPDAMFHWLDRAWAQRDAGIQHLLTDPLILRYKDDPRFAAYCRKVGLPVPGEAGTP